MALLPRRILRLLAATALTLTACVTASAGTTAEAAPGSPALTPTAGLEQLEQLRMRDHRGTGPPGRRRDGVLGHEGRGLSVRRRRRLLVRPAARRGRQPAGQSHEVPRRHEGARRLHPQQGPEVRHLRGPERAHVRAGRGHLPRLHRQQGPRGPGRQHVRLLGRGLPQVRLVLLQRHPGPAGRAVHPHARRPARHRPADRLQHQPQQLPRRHRRHLNWGEVADQWRTTEDLLDIWQNGNTNSYPMGVGNVLDIDAPLAVQSGPGHWNDPDMLVVGRPGLSLTESRSHFALWSLLGAPLIAGNDIRTMSADVSAILRNPRLLAVNQDRLGAGGRRVRDDGDTEVFAKLLSDGSVAVGLFNRGAGTATITTTAAQVGLSGGPFTLTDLWTGGTSSTTGQIAASVPAHGVAVFKVTGGSPLASTTARLRGTGSGRCLDVDRAATAAGTATLIWDCHTAANQLWTTWAGGEIRVYGDKCLDASDQGTTNGTRVIIWPCNSQDNQKWTMQSDGSIRNVHAGLCLDAEQAATANGTPLILWTCNGQDNQKWTALP